MQIARPYAAALYDIARDDGSIEAVEGGLTAIARLAGYESEIECGLVEHDSSIRSAFLEAVSAELPSEDASRGSTEWRFVRRLGAKWGLLQG